MKVCCLLLSIALSCSAAGDHHDHPPIAMTLGTVQSPDQSTTGVNVEARPPRLSEQVQEEQQEALWRKEVLDLLKQLVLVQKEVTKGQGQVLQKLEVLGGQGLQRLHELQTQARHQSLLVESHQAVLLLTSRISTQLQEVIKKLAPPITASSK